MWLTDWFIMDIMVKAVRLDSKIEGRNANMTIRKWRVRTATTAFVGLLPEILVQTLPNLCYARWVAMCRLSPQLMATLPYLHLNLVSKHKISYLDNKYNTSLVSYVVHTLSFLNLFSHFCGHFELWLCPNLMYLIRVEWRTGQTNIHFIYLYNIDHNLYSRRVLFPTWTISSELSLYWLLCCKLCDI